MCQGGKIPNVCNDTPPQPGSQVKSVSDIGAVDSEPLCIVTPTTHRSQPRLGYDHASLSVTLSRKDVTLSRLLKVVSQDCGFT